MLLNFDFDGEIADWPYVLVSIAGMAQAAAGTGGKTAKRSARSVFAAY